MKIVQLNP